MNIGRQLNRRWYLHATEPYLSPYVVVVRSVLCSFLQSGPCKLEDNFSIERDMPLVFLLVCSSTRDLKVPDVAGPYCMVVQFGSGGAVTLASKPVRLGNMTNLLFTIY